MKILLRIIAIMAVALCFASCEEEPEVVDNNQTDLNFDRDIFYSVSNVVGIPSFSGTTEHVTSEAEWDALLEKFCDMTRDGDQVTFCSTKPSNKTKSKSGESNHSNTITTQNREELKAWMKEMEREGKTINVTFDESSGTWHGIACRRYSPQADQAEQVTCSGTLVVRPITIMENSSPIYVLALQSSSEELFVFTVHGMLMMINDNEASTALIEGYEVTLTGMVSTFNDINGNDFTTLELDVNEGDVIILEK